MEEIEEVQTKKQPVITISIHSWATPLVGVVMLLVGLLGGYYGRPLIGGSEEQAVVPRVVALQQSQGGTRNADMMTFLISQARHFRGDPEAPVTLVEFGDFQ